MYRIHSIDVLYEDHCKAEPIISDHIHRGDIEPVSYGARLNSKGTAIVTYWIRPYIYEDFETIMKKLKLAGIHIL